MDCRKKCLVQGLENDGAMPVEILSMRDVEDGTELETSAVGANVWREGQLPLRRASSGVQGHETQIAV